jgi:uncharacterized protein YukJ
MNQGNPIGNHDQDNGIWQDGALMVNLPSQNTSIALFSSRFRRRSGPRTKMGIRLQQGLNPASRADCVFTARLKSCPDTLHRLQ